MSVDSTSLLRLEKTSLREQALTALRKAITSGQLAPGTHLVETELSDALQISRGTLREAMRQLQQEGLISAGARGRLSVRHLDSKEIRDIFNVRAALESLAARELAARPGRAQHCLQARAASGPRGHDRSRAARSLGTETGRGSHATRRRAGGNRLSGTVLRIRPVVLYDRDGGRSDRWRLHVMQEVLMPSTTLAYPQVAVRRFACFRIVLVDIPAGQ